MLRGENVGQGTRNPAPILTASTEQPARNSGPDRSGTAIRRLGEKWRLHVHKVLNGPVEEIANCWECSHFVVLKNVDQRLEQCLSFFRSRQFRGAIQYFQTRSDICRDFVNE